MPAVQKRVSRALEAFPEARSRSQDELKQENADQVNQLLGLFYALLAMSVIISAFGIVNTLTLSIFERTRELGLLRAVGMTRRDVRRMVRCERVITALFGALLGLVLGLFFAFVVIQALEGEGVSILVADRPDLLAHGVRDRGRDRRGDLPRRGGRRGSTSCGRSPTSSYAATTRKAAIRVARPGVGLANRYPWPRVQPRRSSSRRWSSCSMPSAITVSSSVVPREMIERTSAWSSEPTCATLSMNALSTLSVPTGRLRRYAQADLDEHLVAVAVRGCR